MPQVPFNIPDSVTAELGDAFDKAYPGRTSLSPVPTKIQWLKRKTVDYWREIMKSVAASPAADTARQAEIDRVENLEPIT